MVAVVAVVVVVVVLISRKSHLTRTVSIDVLELKRDQEEARKRDILKKKSEFYHLRDTDGDTRVPDPWSYLRGIIHKDGSLAIARQSSTELPRRKYSAEAWDGEVVDRRE